jgi:hypothetical protein
VISLYLLIMILSLLTFLLSNALASFFSFPRYVGFRSFLIVSDHVSKVSEEGPVRRRIGRPRTSAEAAYTQRMENSPWNEDKRCFCLSSVLRNYKVILVRNCCLLPPILWISS